MRTTIQRIALSGLAVTWGWLGFVAGIHAQSVPSTEGPGVLDTAYHLVVRYGAGADRTPRR